MTTRTRQPQKKYQSIAYRCIAAMTVIVCIDSVACRRIDNSKLDAIVSSDGLNAIGLLPMRQKYKFGAQMPLGTAFVVESAMRLTFGAVTCMTSDSAAMFNMLEDVSRYSTEGIKHFGSSIYVSSVSFSEVIVKVAGKASLYNRVANAHMTQVGDYRVVNADTCIVAGVNTLSIGSFVQLMADSSVDYDTKQLIWLAARGRSDIHVHDFDAVFWKFLQENLNAQPLTSLQATNNKITAIDKQFNPCAEGADPKSQNNYECDRNKNYRVKGSFLSVLTRFLEHVKASNDSYFAALRLAGPQAQAAIKGLEVAASVSQTIESSGIVPKTFASADSSVAPMPSRDIIKKVDPAIAVMMPYLPKIQEYFQISIGTSPGAVFDSENPALLYEASLFANAKATGPSSIVGGGSGGTSFGLSEEGEGPVGEATLGTPTVLGESVSTGSAQQPITPQSLLPAGSAPMTQANLGLSVSGSQGTSNIQDVNVGSQKFWQSNGTNSFKAVTDDGHWISNATQNNGVWTYQNSFYPKGSDQPTSQRVGFLGASDLVDGAGKGTYVSYDIPKGETFSSTNTSVNNYKSADKGRIYTSNNGWLDFSNGATVDGQNLSSNPITMDVPGSGQQPVKISPYTFTSSKGDPMYLGRTNGDATSPNLWINRDPNAGMMQGPAAEQQGNNAQIWTPESNVLNDSPKPQTQQQTAPQVTTPTQITVLNTASAIEAQGQVKARRDLLADQLSAQASGQALNQAQKTQLGTLRNLEDKTKKYSDLLQSGTAKPEELQLARQGIGAEDLQTTKDAITAEVLNNPPVLGQKGLDVQTQVVINELDKVKVKQENYNKALDNKSVSDAQLLEQRIAIEAQRLSASKAQVNELQQRFGARYQAADQTTYQRLWSGYQPPTLDTYTPSQVGQLQAVQGQISQTERTIANLNAQRAALNGKKSLGVVVPVGSFGIGTNLGDMMIP